MASPAAPLAAAPAALRVRRFDAAADDRHQLVNMAAHFLALSPYGQFFTSSPAQLAHVIDLTLVHGAVFVAEEDLADGQVTTVGMVGLVRLTHPLTGQLYADEVAWWVEPGWRTRQVGPRLLEAAEAWAAAAGATVIKMVAPAGSPVGEFLARRGYTAVEMAYMRPLQLPAAPARPASGAEED